MVPLTSSSCFNFLAQIQICHARAPSSHKQIDDSPSKALSSNVASILWPPKKKMAWYGVPKIQHQFPMIFPSYPRYICLDNSNLKPTPRGGKHPHPNHHSSDVELSWYSLTFRVLSHYTILYHIVPSFLLVKPRFLILKLPLNITTSSFLLVKYGQDFHLSFSWSPKNYIRSTPQLPMTFPLEVIKVLISPWNCPWNLLIPCGPWHRQKARGRPGVGHEELQWSGFGAALGKLTIASCSWGSSGHVTGDYWKAYWK